jgi:hypothetical protein
MDIRIENVNPMPISSDPLGALPLGSAVSPTRARNIVFTPTLLLSAPVRVCSAAYHAERKLEAPQTGTTTRSFGREKKKIFSGHCWTGSTGL